MHRKVLSINTRKLIPIIGLSLLLGCSDQNVELSLVERQGVTYTINSQIPFTGVVSDYHDNGQLKSTNPYREGKLQGLQQTYFQVKGDIPEDSIERGPLKSQASFIAGKKDGFTESYLENGQLESSQRFSDGKPVGFHLIYRRNGQLESRQHFNDGKLNGLQETYHANGHLSASWNLKDEVKNGPCEEYYKNGQLEYRGQYVDGKIFSKVHYSEIGEVISN